jgi:hypothetical protein
MSAFYISKCLKAFTVTLARKSTGPRGWYCGSHMLRLGLKPTLEQVSKVHGPRRRRNCGKDRPDISENAAEGNPGTEISGFDEQQRWRPRLTMPVRNRLMERYNSLTLTTFAYKVARLGSNPKSFSSTCPR